MKMTRKKKIWLYTAIVALLILIFSADYGQMDGEHFLKVVDKNNVEIQDVIVIPLYSKSVGIGIGPFGMGPRSSASFIVTKPFMLNSGEDIMSRKIPSMGIIVAPFGKSSGLFGGFFSNRNIVRYFFIKKGYAPELIKGDNIYGISSIVMTMADNKKNAEMMKTLIASPIDQGALRSLFIAGEIDGKIDVSFDEQDIALLKSTID
jgi:hypothetical protein